MTAFKEITAGEFAGNPFELIGKKWMLVTAGNEDLANTMTASWGGMGVMWNKNVAFVVIRPTRYTKRFVDGSEWFSLSFLGDAYRKQLNYLGSVSGRDEDKIAVSGLTLTYDRPAPYFGEADEVLICRKLYVQDLTPGGFIEKRLDSQWYPEHDYHTLYVAEINKILIKK